MAGGRKPEFDKVRALDAAMRVFWKKGFLGSALSDLTEAMGINKPSLYASFGNKEELFVQATQHYLDTCAKPNDHLLFEPGFDLATRLKNYVYAVVFNQCEGTSPKGCFVSLCISEAAAEAMPAKAQTCIEAASGHTQQLLEKLFREDSEAHTLKLNENIEENILYLMTLMGGTAAMARAGKEFKALTGVIDRSLSALLHR